ncbi:MULTISPECIES: LolA-like protein [Streptomyces]|uniref:Lipoprotein n=1 Tax=Streptomyces fradiae ATCC 10745 = DSM 40063 TaxID=1319510 RepID=A0A1Y2NWH9_STRFR|nr:MULTISPECIES: hypothetical protein [Streptomyces]OSY51874.1 hypothetical protein BG846_02480 [Streptomyces fradiae ATCC 10745 = DSM 40063]UQS31192.1 hypothetical protein J5J01_05750 [Streptomyces fradiae]
MRVSVGRRLGVSVTAVAVLAAVAGCQGGDGADKGGKKAAADAPAAAEPQWSSALQVIQAAYEKTAAAKSARVRLTMTMPESPAGGAGAAGVAGLGAGGTMEMSGVVGWDPGTMDITMTGDGLLGGGEGSSAGSRLVMVDDVMYMDMGDEAPADLGGKRWLKLDFKALGEKTGDAALRKQLTGSLESMNQDPAKQLAMLLDSPHLKHVGPEKVGGVQTQHYKGTLTVDEMVAANKSLAVLSEKERADLVASMKESGLTAYDTDVWVDADGYPAKMDIGMVTPEGRIEVTATYSDYGAKAAVQAPPAGETFDFMEMMEKLSEAMEDGADADSSAA